MGKLFRITQLSPKWHHKWPCKREVDYRKEAIVMTEEEVGVEPPWKTSSPKKCDPQNSQETNPP